MDRTQNDPLFTVCVRNLAADPRRISWSLPVRWLESCFENTDLGSCGSAGAVDAEVQCLGGEVLVRGTLTARVGVPCARCREASPQQVRSEFAYLFVPERGMSEPRDESDDALDIQQYGGETVVLDDALRDQLVLAAPQEVLCRNDCPGPEIPEHLRSKVSVSFRDESQQPVRAVPPEGER